MGFWLVFFSSPSLGQQAGPDLNTFRQQELRARGGVDSALSALRIAEAAKASNVGELRQALALAEAAYRRAVTARVVVQSSGVDGKPDFAAIQADVASRQAKMRQTVANYLNDRVKNASSSEKPGLQAGAESMLRSLHLESEIVNEAARRANPTANTTTRRMNDLLHRISTTDTNESRENRSAQEHETEMWLRERQRQLDLEEYQRLARNAQFVGSNGQPITGVQRERIALDAEKQLSDSLAYHAREKTPFWDWWNNTTDSRRDLAGRINADIDASPEYQALNYISPADNGTKMQFNALALAVRNNQSKMDEWYTRDYLGQKEPGGESGLKAWWKTGFGTLARANDISGETSNAYVNGKMETMRRDTDAAAAAFTAAARTADPSQLRRDQRELLQRYGYIQEGPDKKLSYTMPQGRRQLGSLTQADMPGASVLDAINMETVAVTVASVALPELAAARASAMAARLGASANVALRAGQVASVATGVGVDAASQYLTTGKVDPQALLLDNLVVGSIAGKIGDAASAGTSKLAGMLRAEGKGGALAKSVEKGVAELLGLSTESALQTAYQNTVAAGRPDLSYEDFLANMMTGALGRSMASAGIGDALDRGLSKATKPAYDSAVARLPEGKLKDVLSRDPALMLEEHHRTAEYAEKERATWERFMKLTDNGKNVDAKVLGEAVSRGDLSWNDMKTFSATGKPELAEIHDSIATARKELVTFLDGAAREHAKTGLASDYDRQLAELQQRKLPQAEFDAEKTKLDTWRDDELARINKPAVILGSDGRGSDIDRSWASDRVRDSAREIQDRILSTDESGAPGPTTGRAYDLNEYYDVMPFLKEMYKNGTADLAALPGEAATKGGRVLSHGETMSASGLAAAMMHMDGDQRTTFEQNKIAAAPEAERAALRDQFAWANENLKQQETQVQERARQIAEKANGGITDPKRRLDPNDPDVQLRARDQLYGERMTELVKLEQQIKGLPDQSSPEAKRLKAEYERKMSVGLREGIEAYSQSAGLDAIVNEWQGTKVKDPATGEMRKRTFEELMSSSEFAPGGKVADKYSKSQLDGMVNDQVMFMMEHMNGYRSGHESPEAAARAIGKYGERALLALKMQGKDINSLPPDHPLRTLMETTQKFMKVKDEPAKLKELLASMSPDGDADKGLRNVFKQLEALPGLEGISKPNAKLDADSMRMANQAARRRWEQERQRARLTGGPMAEMGLIEKQEAEIDRQIEAVQKATDQQKDLDSRYLRKDQREAKHVEEELAALKERRNLLPGGPTSQTETAKKLNSEIESREKRLDELKGKYAAAGSPKDQGPPDLAGLHAPPLAELQDRKKELAAQREACGTGMLLAAEERQKEEVDKAIKDGSLIRDPATGELVPSGPNAAANTAPTEKEGLLGPPSNSGETPLFGDEKVELPPMPEAMRPMPENTDPGGPKSASGGGMKLTIPQTRFRIGATIFVQSETPTDKEWKMPHIAVFGENGARHTYFDLPQRGRGTKAFAGPLTAGNYEIRAITNEEAVVIRLPFQVIAVPTPGALSVDDKEPLIGSKIQVRVNAPEGTWSKSPWVGMYLIDRESGRGPLRLTWTYLKNLNSSVEFTLPNYSANLEFRLFDRDGGSYQLDALMLRSRAVSAPGSLKLSKKAFSIGEPVPVTLNVPEEVYLEPNSNAWVGLYDVSRLQENQADVLGPPRLTFQYVNTRQGSLTFNAPPMSGIYELRLYDRYSGTLLLDAVRFTMSAKLASGALTAASPKVNMGQKFMARLAVPDDIYLERWAHVSFHLVDGGAATGELAPRLGKQYLPDQKTKGRHAELAFTAPDYPGKFELRLYDRDNGGILLASAPVEVVGKGAPGALQIAKDSYSPGAVVDVTVRPPPDVTLFRWAQVTLHQTPGLGRDFRANDAPRLTHGYVDEKTRAAKITLPDVPGRYELRLYDRESTGFHLLDRKFITVAQPSTKGSLRPASNSAPAGGRIQVTCAVPQGVYLGAWPIVEIVSLRRKVLGGAWTNESRVSSATFEGKKRGGSLELGVPSIPGQYEFRFYDRDGDGLLLDSAPLTVTPAPPK